MPERDPSLAARLRRFLFRGAATQAFCVLIALVLWQLAHGDLAWTLAYSLAIGNISWLTIDLGIHGIALALDWRGGVRRRSHDWPGLPGMVLAVIVGAATGYTLGAALVDRFSGFRSPSLFDSHGSGIITLFAAVTMTWFFFSRERLQAERMAAEAARRSAAEHQLKLLESQLEPHMLFNTLANLRVLIGLDPPRAQAMLDRLIAFLRATLSASRAGAHPLQAEFDRLADYLALMEVRMGARLQVHFELPDELRGQPVPPLLLQPLVENAIKHGLEPKVEGGRIEVAARRDAQDLVLMVRDSGVGLGAGAPAAPAPVDEPAASRYGTHHVRERLAALYGARASLRLEPAPGREGGTQATVTLPLPA